MAKGNYKTKIRSSEQVWKGFQNRNGAHGIGTSIQGIDTNRKRYQKDRGEEKGFRKEGMMGK